MTEVRRVEWPFWEGPEWSDPTMFQQGIAGALELFFRAWMPFQQLVGGSHLVTSCRCFSESIRRATGCRSTSACSDDTDTLLVFGLDHLLTEQEASPEEIDAVRRWLAREGTVLILGPHHDVGISADMNERAMEYAHHGDALVPRQQRFGKYTRSLMKGLGVPVENRFGLRPGVVEGTRQIAPLTINRDLDTRGWLEGVTNFSFHKHLPHYAVTTDGNCGSRPRPPADRPVQAASVHRSRKPRVQLVRVDAARGRARRRGAARRLDDLQHAVRRRRQPEALLEEPRVGKMSSGPATAGLRGLSIVLSALSALLVARPADAQNRGVYPLGMSATNSGVTPDSGFSYVNQLLFYSRNESRGPEGDPVATGNNSVILSMNSFVWVSQKEVLGGAKFSMSATLPIANNSLSSNAAGAISGGGGFGDSYYQPFILGWNHERVALRAVYGFLAPTGDFEPGTSTNVGSGYWTHVVASGQTWYLTSSRATAISAFQMYEFHNTQKGTNLHPGDNLDLDYSVTQMFAVATDVRIQAGLVGYGAWQMTGKSGPAVTLEEANSRYTVNAVGFDGKCGVAAAQGESGSQIFQGIRKPIDIPGILDPDFRLGWFLETQRGPSGPLFASTSVPIFRWCT